MLISVLTDFRTTVQRDPSREFEESDCQTLLNLRNSVLKKFNIDEDILPVDYLE